MWIKLEIQAERATEKQTERKGLKERRSVSKRVTESACVCVCVCVCEGEGTRERNRQREREGGERERERERNLFEFGI